MKEKLKKSKKSGKRIRLISIRKLQKQCEAEWKELVKLRDKGVCQVSVHFPDIKVNHSVIMQADHCFSRINKMLFLDEANGTLVCSSCNRAKAWGQKSIQRAIDDIVRMREGSEAFDRMYALDRSYKTNELWTNREWLANKLERLNELKQNV